MAKPKAKRVSKNSRPKNGKPKLTVVFDDKPSSQEREYIRSLHRIIDEIYTEAAEKFDWTWNQLAVNAGLAYETVARLGDRSTRFPRYYTVHKLAKAVGWNLVATTVKNQKSKVKIAS